MRLRDATRQAKSRGEKALVAFLTAGYPDEKAFVELVRGADRAGSDIIEIGIPFSDPIADGPLIQASSMQALANGMTLRRAFELAATLTPEIKAPLVFMTYYNPILRLGTGRFVDLSRRSDIAGAIVPDVPFEESSAIRSACGKGDITYIDLIAPTSSDERIDQITGRADGFVYLVSVTGVTGMRSPDAHDIETFVNRVRRKTDLPLYIGFGISDSEKAAAAARHSDGVIIGSALVQLIESSSSGTEATEKVFRFLREVKSVLRNAPDPKEVDRP